MLDGITVWHALYLVIFIAAILTRFWALGDRALHHDESLHTFYSWVYSEGRGYTHHPMTHGPFLFHANAFTYLLLGDNDYTSRLPAALFGVALVMLPWFLRSPSLLGRWGALASSFLILISPSILYYSRFIRHDIFALVGVMLIFIAFIRYMERPQRRWIILAIVSVAFVVTTHEITFVNLLIFGTFASAWILYRLLPAGFVIIAAGALLFLLSRVLYDRIGVRDIPEIPWESPSNAQVINYLGGLLTHPVVVTLIASAVIAVIAILWLIVRRHRLEDGWIDGTLGAGPDGTTASRFAISLHDRRGWLIGALSGGVLFVVLYTSLFSNLGGIGSGTLGSIGYWLAQHDVQRGQQPWFYYFVLAPQYEYLAIAGSIAAAVMLAWRGRRIHYAGLELDRRFYTLLLILYWAALMFLVLSWAGEKMPWLIVHFLLPMLLLAGAAIGSILEWVERQCPDWRRTLSGYQVQFGIPAAVLLIASILLLNWASAGPFVESGESIARTVRPEIAGNWLIIYVPALLAIVLFVAAAIQIGSKRIMVVAGSVIAVLLVALQINAGWSLNYRTGDVPRDMLIYVQTSPDLHNTVRDLEVISQETTGGMQMPVLYTGGTQWPLNWYLRNFTSRTLLGEIPEEPTAPFIFALPGDIGIAEEERLVGYRYIEFPLRWWIPENQTYRAFAIAPEVQNEARQNLQTDDPPPYDLGDVIRSLGRTFLSIREPEQQAELFRLIVHRELTAPVGSFDVRLYIHPDYVDDFYQHRRADRAPG